MAQSTQALPNSHANYWFSFGDSYTMTSFNALGPVPNDENPLGNPPFPGLTAVGGTNWVGYVTKTFNRSLLYTYNYAFGGATLDPVISPPGGPGVQTLTHQVIAFLNTVSEKPATTPWKSHNSLFSIWIGINDITVRWFVEDEHGVLANVLLGVYFALVQNLYDAGGRNFLFVNVPPVDRSPNILVYPKNVQDGVAKAIESFNRRLIDKIKAFQGSNEGVNVWLYDSHTQFTAILDAPKRYGFLDATSYGPGRPDFFWGDGFHPSEAVHKLIGEHVGKIVLGRTIW